MPHCTHCAAAFTGRGRYCPDCRDTGAPWRVDHAALDRARAHLGIDCDVVVRRVATRKLLGRYHGARLRPDAPSLAVAARMTDEQLTGFMYHLVTVSTRLTPEHASRALWHELTHAAQYEADPDAYVEGYHAEMEDVRRVVATGVPLARAYRAISFAVEAKANELLHDTIGSLALPNKRASLPPLKVPHARIAAVVDGRIVPGAGAEAFERFTRVSIEEAVERRGG